MHSSSGANRPFKDQQWLRILQWDAGGFSHEKRTQLMSILISQDIDVFILVISLGVHYEKLKEVTEEIQQEGFTAFWFVCDVTSEEDVNAKARQVEQKAGETIRAFLPNMEKNNHGHIVGVSSCAGLVGHVNQIDYS
ncbi:epidermal retinol dehydrogenase 2 [Trichonephila clavipes]|uniref:Epidermal retinol dehydrogenase 2 n=1 Tax=Trichonephila clavipes TaxID=2585209 RepID=A0A8X6W666_TRICX|nr:epidermal retinol dehydrogenase 2 [Trichonephila clavipes]